MNQQGMSYEQFSSYIAGKMGAAKGAMDSVVVECLNNIRQLIEANGKLKKEIEELSAKTTKKPKTK